MKRLIGLNIATALVASLAVVGAADARTRLSGAGASFPSKFTLDGSQTYLSLVEQE